jgi:quinolinate synthase
LRDCLKQGSNEIEVNADIGARAFTSLERMMNFKV